MNSQPTPSWPWHALAVGATALAYLFATGVNEIWPLAWIAPIPILMLAFVTSPRATLVASFLAYLLGEGSYLPMAKIVPLVALLIGCIVAALAFAIIVRITRAAVTY